MRTRRFNLFAGAIAALSLYDAPPGTDGGGGGAPPADPPPAGDPPPPPPPAKTPEETKAENLAAIKGVLKLPDGSTLDPTLTERIAAIASERGLHPDQAKAVFDTLATEAAAHGEKAVVAAFDALKPGNPGWQRQQDEYKAAALADPVLGNNKPEQLEKNMTLAKRVLATFFGTPEQVAALEQSGLANNPAALRGLVAIGNAMKEDQFVPAPAAGGRTEQDRLEALYPSMKKTA